MRPARGVFHRMTTFESLWNAARAARRGKRRARGTALFEHRLEYELLALQAQLREGTFAFGPYREFRVHEPAPRLIRAAPYRDRVVHHALVAQLEPLLERHMLPCSFACRVGYGSHKALDMLQQHLRGGQWVLKVDVSKYFYSINHDLLKASVFRHVACPRTRELIAALLTTYSAHDEYYFPQPNDDLFDVLRRRGVPIGNLTSQLFANWYLQPVDDFIKRQLGWRRYVRYMDDLVFVGPSKAAMTELQTQVCTALRALRLTPHPTKTQISPATNGVRFLGFRVYAHHRRLLRGNIRRFNARMRRYRWAVERGEMTFDAVRLSLRSWLGYADPLQHGGLIERLLDQHAFTVPGRSLPQRFTLRAPT